MFATSSFYSQIPIERALGDPEASTDLADRNALILMEGASEAYFISSVRDRRSEADEQHRLSSFIHLAVMTSIATR